MTYDEETKKWSRVRSAFHGSNAEQKEKDLLEMEWCASDISSAMKRLAHCEPSPEFRAIYDKLAVSLSLVESAHEQLRGPLDPDAHARIAELEQELAEARAKLAAGDKPTG